MCIYEKKKCSNNCNFNNGIGFAAISTTLIINGNAKVSENTDDFNVIFTEATLDWKDIHTNVIDDTKKTINFSTNYLKALNQTNILT